MKLTPKVYMNMIKNGEILKSHLEKKLNFV